MAQERQWGSQVLFTYGPLGYLNFTRYAFFDTWLHSFLVNVVMHLIFVGALLLLLLERRAGIRWWILLALLVLLPLPALPSMEHECVLATFALLVVGSCADDERLRIGGAAGAGVLVAFLALVKGTSLVSGVLLLAVFGSFAVWQSMRRPALVAVASAAVAFTILWVLAGQSAPSLLAYVKGELQLISGYSVAMGVDGNIIYPPKHLPAQLWASALALIGIGGQAAWMVYRRDWPAFRILVMSMPVLFVDFKEGFVRFGANQTIFYAMLILVETMVLIALSSRPHKKPDFATGSLEPRARRFSVVAPSVAIMVAATAVLSIPALVSRTTVLPPTWPLSDLNNRVASYGDALRMVDDPGARIALSDAVVQQMRLAYALTPAQLSEVRSLTTDVSPWDIGIVHAYDLNYRPRPVMASYAAYTPYLDDLDATALAAPDGPMRLLATYATIDDRYAGFDEPAAFRAMLEHYAVIDASPSVLVLGRQPERSYQEVRVGEAVSTMGRVNHGVRLLWRDPAGRSRAA